jgi:hypothetical protein
MNFQNSLTEFNFNLETLDLLKNEKLDDSEIIDTLIEAGFNSELTQLLLTLNRSYLKSVLVRLKLYNKLNKNGTQVMDNLQDYQNLKPLVHQLFSTSDNLNVTNYESPKNNTNVKNDKEVEVNEEVNDEVNDKVNEEFNDEVNDDNNGDESSDEENFYENFFMECLESTDNKKDTVKSKEIYSSFKSWYINKFTSSDVPSKTLLKKFLNEKLGKPVKSSWSSLKLTV